MTKHRSASLLLQPNPFIEDPVKYSRAAAGNTLGLVTFLTQSQKRAQDPQTHLQKHGLCLPAVGTGTSPSGPNLKTAADTPRRAPQSDHSAVEERTGAR